MAGVILRYTDVRIHQSVPRVASELRRIGLGIASTTYFAWKMEIITCMLSSKKLKVLTLASFITVLVPIACFGDNRIVISLRDLQHRIESEGAQVAVERVYAHPQHWEALLRKIESGDPDWIRVGASLKKGADAGAAHGLEESLGQALEISPQILLALASRYELSISDFCRAPDVDDPRYSSYETNIRGLRRRVAAVEAVKEQNLAPYRSLCLQSLTKEEQAIARFFEEPGAGAQ